MTEVFDNDSSDELRLLAELVEDNDQSLFLDLTNNITLIQDNPQWNALQQLAPLDEDHQQQQQQHKRQTEQLLKIVSAVETGGTLVDYLDIIGESFIADHEACIAEQDDSIPLVSIAVAKVIKKTTKFHKF